MNAVSKLKHRLRELRSRVVAKLQSESVKKVSSKLTAPIRALIKVRKYIALGILFLLLLTTSLGIGTFTAYSRHRQLCTIQDQIDNEVFTYEDSASLCPDILDSQNWPSIAKNIFTKRDIANSVQISEAYDPDLVRDADISCNSELDPICWLEQLEGDLAQTDGFTNVLLVSTDTRENNIVQGNTDSIMLVSYQYSSGQVLLTSFPRDLVVQTINPLNQLVLVKISAIFGWYPYNGDEVLMNTVERITGKPVHYHAFINFNSFRYAIDRVGGIDIYLDEPFEDAFPRGEIEAEGYGCEVSRFNSTYCMVRFPSGWNKFNSFDAMIYSRSRYLSSDYDRAARQQEIAEAALQSALNPDGSIIDQFNTYLDIYENIRSNIQTNIGLNNISGMYALINQLSGDAAKIVLDPTLNNYSIIYEAGYTDLGYASQFYDYSYASYQNYVQSIWDWLPYHIEQPKIKVINTTGQPLPEGQFIRNMVDFGIYFAEIVYKEDTSIELTGIRIYDISEKGVEGSVKDLNSRIEDSLIYNPIIDEVEQTEDGEDILIIVGSEELDIAE